MGREKEEAEDATVQSTNPSARQAAAAMYSKMVAKSTVDESISLYMTMMAEMAMSTAHKG